jgi:hypothetical protein
VQLRALVPAFTVESLAAAARVAMRTAVFVSMADAWAQRPAATVAADPTAWWRHAGNLVIRECRLRRRQKASIIASIRLQRVKQSHGRLYRRLHLRDPTFCPPERKYALHVRQTLSNSSWPVNDYCVLSCPALGTRPPEDH